MLQLIPVIGWGYIGETAEIWQAPFLGGKQCHKCTSWPPPRSPSQWGHQGHLWQCSAAGIFWLQGTVLEFHNLWLYHPPHWDRGYLVGKQMPICPANTRHFLPPSKRSEKSEQWKRNKKKKKLQRHLVENSKKDFLPTYWIEKYYS